MLTRGHWSIENQLHLNLDITFKEDAGRARKGDSELHCLRIISWSCYCLPKFDAVALKTHKIYHEIFASE